MTKKYNTPMLQVVSINHNDIITGSNEPQVAIGSGYYTGGTICAPDRFDDWDAGY